MLEQFLIELGQVVLVALFIAVFILSAVESDASDDEDANQDSE